MSHYAVRIHTFMNHWALYFHKFWKEKEVLLLSYNKGILYEYVRDTFQPRVPFKTEIATPSDSYPILNARKKLIYFGLQKGGFGLCLNQA